MRSLALVSVSAIAALGLLAQTGNRKVTSNPQSPSADTSMKLNGKAVTIEYNAPAVRGRKVEGGLVPFGNVWRLGADSATTLTTDADVMIGTLKVPKGAHTLYILASEGGGWKLIVNKQVGQWGTEYSAPQDLGRVDMKVTKLAAPVEKLDISLKGTGAAGMLTISWGNTQATIPVKLA